MLTLEENRNLFFQINRVPFCYSEWNMLETRVVFIFLLFAILSGIC